MTWNQILSKLCKVTTICNLINMANEFITAQCITQVLTYVLLLLD
jgi:hypothetical protein